MSLSPRAVLGVSLVVALNGTAALAQSVISAHSGLIHYVEGRVLLDGRPVEVSLTAFPEVKPDMELRTEDGRAEVLLNPGVFLRLAEHSAIRMVNNKLTDSRVEFLSGSAVIEASRELSQKDTAVTIDYKGSSALLRKSGIYRFNSDPAEFRVYSGEAELKTDSNVLVVKAGKEVSLNGMVAVEKFDTKDSDSLDRWSQRRAEYVSMANISSAKYVSDSGSSWGYSGWNYNPYFGMYTYLPMNGMFYSPYGYPYFAPTTVYRVYRAPGAYVGNTGFGTNKPASITPTPGSGSSSSTQPTRGGFSSAPMSSGSMASGSVRSGGGRSR